MNAVEQRDHRTVTRALQQQINDLVAIVSALEAQQATIYGEAVDTLAKERTARQTMGDKLRATCQERWDSASATHKSIGDRHADFVGRGFWSRLNWLVTGH